LYGPRSALEAVNAPEALYLQGGSDWIEYAAALSPQVHGGVYVLRIFIEKQKNDKRLRVSIRPAADNDTVNSGTQSIENVVLLDQVQSLMSAYFEKPDPGVGEASVVACMEWKYFALADKIQITDSAGDWPEMVIAPQIRVKM
jgi:hypothetical protein